jgi:DNA-binding CsgD family transcriptional regulator
VLANAEPPEWAALAHHWAAAHEDARALAASLAAADTASGMDAFADARRQLERARELWSRVPAEDRPPGLEETELLRRLADTARLAGDWESAMEIAEAALRRAEQSGDDLAAARLHHVLGHVHRGLEPAREHFRRALELLPDEPTEERSAITLSLASASSAGGPSSVARREHLQALAVARAAGALADEGRVHRGLGTAYAYGGDPERALRHFAEAWRIAVELDRAENATHALNNHGDALMMLGRVEDALETFEAGFEYIRRSGLALSYGLVVEANMAQCELHLGRWPQAGARLQRILGESEHQPDIRLLLSGLTVWLAAREGRLEEAEPLDRDIDALLRESVSPPCAHIASAARAEYALGRGDLDAALAIAGAADRRHLDLYNTPMLLSVGLEAAGRLAAAARARGSARDLDAARAAAAEVREHLFMYGFEEPVGAPAPPELLTRRTLADAELAEIDGTPRPDLWAEAAGRWDALRDPYHAACARLREAQARLGARAGRAEAATALRSAHVAAVSLGAEPLRAEIEALARRARLDLAALPAAETAAERPLDLTPRELTVLTLVASGHTNRQIAEELFLSRRTVDMHVRHILAKLNADNRVEAAGVAHRMGLVP